MGRSRPRSWAAVSTCRIYRYRLVRVWDPNKPQLAWITLTGSDADDHCCIGAARGWGYGGIHICNLYGLGREARTRCGGTQTRSAPTMTPTWLRWADATT